MRVPLVRRRRLATRSSQQMTLPAASPSRPELQPDEVVDLQGDSSSERTSCTVVAGEKSEPEQQCLLPEESSSPAPAPAESPLQPCALPPASPLLAAGAGSSPARPSSALQDTSPSLLALHDAIFHSDEPFLADHPRPISPAPERRRSPQPQPRRQRPRSRGSAGSSPDGVHHLKRVAFGARRVPIVMQNANGPCPLIAVANTLLLRGRVVIPEVVSVVTTEQLVEYVSDAVADAVDRLLDDVSAADDSALEERRAAALQAAQDALALLPELRRGLDVNVRFGGVRDFEASREGALFDALRIPLYHGWLLDPHCARTLQAVGARGYNQLVDFILANKNSPEQRLRADALRAEQFLAETATQLTWHGLCELAEAAREGQAAVFFRNNHFSTLYKHQGRLFLLVTDQGFLHEPSVVWETLSSIDGESEFVDGAFLPATLEGGGGRRPSAQQQIACDEALARALAAEEEAEEEKGRAPAPASTALVRGRFPSRPGPSRRAP